MGHDYFDGVILDIDGTIWDTTEIVATAWNKAIDVVGAKVQKLDAFTLRREFGKTMDTIASDLWPELDEAMRSALMSRCCYEEQTAIRENSRNITYQGVVETVRYLSAMQNFYIVSNCQSGYIELTLEKTGLSDCIKDFECFGRTGKGKAENILILCSRNSIKAPVYVGDTQGDSDACMQAGIPFIWAAYGFGSAEGYIERIGEFSDLKHILRSE